MSNMRNLRARAGVLLVVAALLPVAAEAQTQVKPGWNVFKPEQDVEIGRQSVAQIEQQLPTVKNDRVNDFVNEIGNRLAAHAPGPKFPYQFGIVNASDLNAFALPGGPIYLNRGIIEAARNDGEIAGVLAHEIAHVALRHGTANASKQQATQAGLGILGGLLGGRLGGNTAQIVNAVGGFGLNALFLKYSRAAETQADIIGAQILAKAGYSPQDMVSFFQTLEKQDKRKKANFLASHPAPAERVKTIQNEARVIGATMDGTTSSQKLRSVQASLKNLPAARTTSEISQEAAQRQPSRDPRNDPRNDPRRSGQVGRAEPPSRSMRTYTNRGRMFQLQVPSNWQVAAEGEESVTLTPPNGALDANGRMEIVYGLIVNHYSPFGNSRGRVSASQNTIEAATDDLMKQISQTSPHLRMVRGSGQSFRLAGGKGLGASLSGTSPVTGVRERVTVITRQLVDGHLIYLLFVTPEDEVQAYGPTLSSIVNSFQIDDDGRH